MGFVFSKLFGKLASKKEVKLLMLGIGGAGKTKILYQLKMGEPVNTVPTIGFNVETLEHKGIKFTVWDLGGGDKLRILWKNYYVGNDGLIYVVDANDKDTIDKSAEEFKKLMKEEELKDCVILVMANKQDLNNTLSPGVITDKLGMKLLKGRTWFVQGTSAITGQGLKEGLDWMVSVLLKKKK